MTPAKKKRKTTNGSVPVGSRRTTQSQRPSLSIEIIAKVASFAAYGNDLMNICKTVGPRGCADIRYTCLRNNMDFLRQALQSHTENMRVVTEDADDIYDLILLKVSAWMNINTDWTKHCSSELIDDVEVSTATFIDAGGARTMPIRRANPLILFNNPAVAIEFGQIKILKYLVETMGVDINGSRWNGYFGDNAQKYHLLVLAALVSSTYEDSSCFNYLVAREELDPCTPCYPGANGPANQLPLWSGLYQIREISCALFEATIRHQNFDPYREIVVSEHHLNSLHMTMMITTSNADQDDSSLKLQLEKFKCLLNMALIRRSGEMTWFPLCCWRKRDFR